MERTITATEANREFSRLLGEVAAGEKFVVTSHGRPVARLEPVGPAAEVADPIVAARREHLRRLVSQTALGQSRFSREDFYD